MPYIVWYSVNSVAMFLFMIHKKGKFPSKFHSSHHKHKLIQVFTQPGPFPYSSITFKSENTKFKKVI